MQVWGVRLFFIIASAVSCYFVYDNPFAPLIGLVVALILVGAEFCLHIPNLRGIIASLIGLSIGLLISCGILSLFSVSNDNLKLVISLGIGYAGLMSGYWFSTIANLSQLLSTDTSTGSGESRAGKTTNNLKILDTSVIIDGRILEICQTKFIEGTLVIPRFVLNELQHIADSTEPLRRNKGRRGFDILRALQNNPAIVVEISEEEVPHLPEVDAKLVHLAQKRDATIITNDLNLNKVAELQSVKVLNINELSNAVRPVVIAGEVIQVLLLKEGKEPNQGVGYLDDGTMVIVEEGKPYIGQTLNVEVTQMLRTSAGQMIFTRIKENEVDTDEQQGMHPYSRSW
ncbi:twitching motility protein PilT [Candidatus Poribacteria bacterium]|nr:MAG: twitching motility protein PilT [Candidatus Poribacteria bacterium]